MNLVRRFITFAAALLSVGGSAASGHEREQIDTVAAVLWGEARGEGLPGICAVAEVIRNRTWQPRRWSATAYGVVTQHRQFSCLNGISPEDLVSRAKTSTGRDRLIWNVCVSVTTQLVHRTFSDDRLQGATHYCTGKPAWAEGMVYCGSVGKHKFYR